MAISYLQPLTRIDDRSRLACIDPDCTTTGVRDCRYASALAAQRDLNALRGGWYSVATIRRHFTVTDHILPGTNNASWRVKIFWPISLPFLVLYTDPAYRFVLFGEKDHSFGGVYSRTPTIDDTNYHALLDRLTALGYDSTRFRKVVHFSWHIGMRDFWSDGITAGREAPGSTAKCRFLLQTSDVNACVSRIIH